MNLQTEKIKMCQLTRLYIKITIIFDWKDAKLKNDANVMRWITLCWIFIYGEWFILEGFKNIFGRVGQSLSQSERFKIGPEPSRMENVRKNSKLRSYWQLVF